jgi:hypothetical protein
MKTKATSLGLTLGLALASLALAAQAQRGPAAGNANNQAGYGPGTNATVGMCNGTGPGANAAVGACDGTGPRAMANCPSIGAQDCTGTCAVAAADPTPLVLGPEAQAALRFQIDEERMARELYTAFGTKWGLQPFKMIPQSEARHEAVLRQLAVRAGVTAPVATAGLFETGEVQLRFDALLALGLESADSALRAAAFIEEQDIADLDTLIAATDSPALKEAATALRNASANHLRAFVGTLKARGVTYEPKLLKAEEFTALVNSTARGMGTGAGRGQGFGYGRR